MSDEGTDIPNIPGERTEAFARAKQEVVESLKDLSYDIRLPIARFIMWLLKPVLGVYLAELSKMQELIIQRTVHFSDVREDAQGNIKFHTSETRQRFVNKE